VSPSEVAVTPTRVEAVGDESEPEAPFDPQAAWAEFEACLRDAYAYLERSDFAVDEQLEHSRKLVLQTTDPAQFRSILHRTTFAFTDPHFIVGPFDDADPNIIPTSSDLVIERRDDRAYVVVDVRADSAADAAGVRPGWILRNVDGQTVDVAIKTLWDGVVLAGTPRQRSYAATLVANGRREGNRALVFDVEGHPQTVELTNPRAFADQVAERTLLQVQVRDDVAFIRFENSLGDNATIEAFDDAMASLPPTRALVLDLRNTPSGGNTDVARSIIGHFIDTTRPYQVHQIPAVQRRTTVPRRFIEQVLPRAPHYDKPVAVLGGHWTGSMGEGLLIGMDGAAEAHTIASDMADLLGALHNFQMERSDVLVDIGAEALFHIDGTPRESFEADTPLRSADRDPTGADPTEVAVRQWLSGLRTLGGLPGRDLDVAVRHPPPRP
jgi:carboxyl-terminal processing protease